MHSKNISQCQTEELDDSDSAHRNLENFSDDSNGPLSTLSKQTIQKNLQPLKIKIPKQSKPPKCENEKPMCEAKSNLKRKLENDKEVENKGFNMVIWLNSWNIWTIILKIYFRAQKKY